MKHIFLPLSFLLLFFWSNIFAQTTNDSLYQHPIYLKSTGNTGTGANIDVVYHAAKWNIDPDDATKTITGSITTYFKTIKPNVNSINFDFNKASFNNGFLSVSYHGSNTSFSFPNTGNVDIININLPSVLINFGTLDSITINYQGVPPPASGAEEGYQRKVDNAGNNYVYTLSESYEDRDWWPCKADMQDKIDSMDISVVTPNAFWVATNGVLVDSTDDGTNRKFLFKTRYPIASYLVAVGVAKYKRFYLGNVNSNATQVPFVVNIFSGKTAAEESNIMIRLNNNKLIFNELCKLYGDYPFAKEKHGYYEFGFSGGMEHQTMSGMGTSSLTSNTVLAHELGHQWFGDKVTMATWNHLWLAEGFAVLSETVAFEQVPSIGINTINKMASIKSQARSINGTSVFLNNISNSNNIWSGSNNTAVYQKGCMVASQLRCLLGDTKFFKACRNYLNDTALAYKSATTADLQRNIEAEFGENMSSYFNEWIIKTGSPDYTVQWGNVGNKINIKLAQIINNGGVPATASTFLPMPVVLKISNTSLGLDTTITIYHKAANVTAYAGDGIGATVNSNTISFNLPFVPTSVTFDPLNRTMANGTVSFSAALPVLNFNLILKKVNENSSLFTININSTEKLLSVSLEKSEDGKTFSTLNEMSLIKKTNETFIYQLNETNVIKTSTFYRAKITTTSGEVYFSNVIQSTNKSLGINVYPNPAKDNIIVDFNNWNNQETLIKLVDVSGKLLYQTKTIKDSVTINTKTFKQGNYFLQLSRNNETLVSKKFVIVK